jgi:hypothetical protein
LDKWAANIAIKARMIEFIGCYAENVPADSSQLDGCIFRVGHTGAAYGPAIGETVKVIGGQYIGSKDNPSTFDFMSVDRVKSVSVVGTFITRCNAVFRSTENTEDRALFLSGVRSVGHQDFHVGNSRVLAGTYDQYVLNSTSDYRIITKTDVLEADYIFGNQPAFISSGDVSGKRAKTKIYSIAVPVSTGGAKLVIPIESQLSLNMASIIKISGQSAKFNSTESLPFSADIGFGSFSSISNLSAISSNGNIAGVAAAGSNIEVTFATAYTDGLFLNIQITSPRESTLLPDSIVLTA